MPGRSIGHRAPSIRRGVEMTQPKLNISQTKGRWWLVQTRPTFERRFAADLERANVAHFLPMMRLKRTRPDRGRLRSVEQVTPLFPTYLFAIFPKDERPDGGRSIAQPTFIRVVDQDALRAELSNLQIALGIDDTLSPRPIVQNGQRVRVVSGPFINLEGEVIHTDSHCRIQLSVTTLGRAVEVSVPAEQIEAV